jgi:hypothetical protein
VVLLVDLLDEVKSDSKAALINRGMVVNDERDFTLLSYLYNPGYDTIFHTYEP